MAGLLIGKVAARTGVSVPAIRYYESLGLLAPAARSTAGYRRYSEAAIEEILFIKKAQRLGFTLEEIADILQLGRAGQTTCARVLELAREHRDALDERIRQLTSVRERLALAITTWDGRTAPTCQGLCRIIARLDAPDEAGDDGMSASIS